MSNTQFQSPVQSVNSDGFVQKMTDQLEELTKQCKHFMDETNKLRQQLQAAYDMLNALTQSCAEAQQENARLQALLDSHDAKSCHTDNQF